MEHILHLNGRRLPLDGEHRQSLADCVREAGATSVHLGCEHGVCGTCNVLVDGRIVRSCLTLSHACTGAEVVTLEGLNDPLAERLRAAFKRCHALQCGYCTPGMFVAAHEFLTSGLEVNEANVREALAGNICRCTGYQGIVDAVLQAATAEESA
ncbi:(2Fe-2S)-binding protein [Ramlibacter sp.]|uniref:(2Fe-2S)-binding protein n=1 Tax=Ramlibacter sp. TaxID=1917967 RepID=UPI003D0D2F08